MGAVNLREMIVPSIGQILRLQVAMLLKDPAAARMVRLFLCVCFDVFLTWRFCSMAAF